MSISEECLNSRMNCSVSNLNFFFLLASGEKKKKRLEPWKTTCLKFGAKEFLRMHRFALQQVNLF